MGQIFFRQSQKQAKLMQHKDNNEFIIQSKLHVL